MNTYSRIFGSGPLGIAISLVLLLAARVAAQIWPTEPILPRPIRWAILAAGLMGLVILVAWSLRSLPPGARGVRLQTSGAFRFVRHPLYAAFLSFFNFALALFLGHPAYLAWAILLHPAWHLIIRHEEALMREAFGERYQRYARVTGRFFPRRRRSGAAWKAIFMSLLSIPLLAGLPREPAVAQPEGFSALMTAGAAGEALLDKADEVPSVNTNRAEVAGTFAGTRKSTARNQQVCRLASRWRMGGSRFATPSCSLRSCPVYSSVTHAP